MKKLVNLIVLFSILVFIGCGIKPEDKLKDFMECSMAANTFGDYKSMKKIKVNMMNYLKSNEKYFNEHIGNVSAFLIKMREDIFNDLHLYRYSSRGQLKIWKDIYQSDKCQELYK